MRRRLLLILMPVTLLVAAGYGLYAWLFADLPNLDSLSGRLNLPSVRIVDRHGRLLYEVLPEEGGRHAVVPLETIPLALRQATIATEDRSFYTNPGVDVIGIVRAFWINLQGGETVAGGSTITQQVARNLLMDAGERAERSLRRKLRESYLAWQLTRRRSKDDILALYLNQSNYGGMAYGVEAAAQTFFGKPVSDLDLAECALLAGLPQAPSLYNPFTNPETAKARQEIVLDLMEKQGYITAEQHELARREPLAFAETPYPIEAPHFVMLVRAQLDSLLTPEQIYQYGGVIVQTTIDLDWQRLAERAIQHQLEKLADQQRGLGHNVSSAALVALDPYTGEILTMLGSPDYFDAEISGAINMALAPRQPGSSIKPLVYAAALDPDQPNPWTAATLILDVRAAFVTHEGDSYVPENYDKLEHGPVLVRQALASSLNIPAVLALDHVGLPKLFDLAARLGITTLGSPDDYDLSLALGGGDVRLLELTGAFGAFANGGYRLSPYAIEQITDLQGNLIYQAEPAPQVRVLDERVAWLISDILSDDEARRLGFGVHSILNIDRPAAIKTGTTSNFHDNWAIGYTPDLVVGVWAGNTNYEPMRDVTGLTGAAPIWHQFIRNVLSGTPRHDFTRPDGLVKVEVCALSGLLPTTDCPYRRTEWFIQDTQPTKPDDLYRRVTIDSATGLLAGSSTPPGRRQSLVVLDLPPEAAPWAHAEGLTLYSDLFAGATSPYPLSSAPLALFSPAPNAVFRLSATLPAEAQRVHLLAVGEPGLQQVILYIDGLPIATLDAPPFEAWWQPQVGIHQAWAVGTRQSGESVETGHITFEVAANE
jgi:1A family penicillin-binding protein